MNADRQNCVGSGRETEAVEAEGWQRLDGIDPDSDSFPARARLSGEMIVIFQTAEGFRGVERQCPHQKMPLHDAVLQGGNMIRCRWHHYVYRLSDGKGVNCPGYRLRVFDVERRDDALYARPAE